MRYWWSEDLDTDEQSSSCTTVWQVAKEAEANEKTATMEAHKRLKDQGQTVNNDHSGGVK